MNTQSGNKMADMPIKSLLLNMGTPMMISMLGHCHRAVCVPGGDRSGVFQKGH